MSKDIWHSKNKIPELRGKQIIIKFQDNCWDLAKITRTMQEDWDDYYETAWLEWAYLDDLLALETELDRTRKALDVAVDALKRLEKELYFNNAKQTGHIADSVISIPSIALEQITALEQKDVK